MHENCIGHIWQSISTFGILAKFEQTDNKNSMNLKIISLGSQNFPRWNYEIKSDYSEFKNPCAWIDIF